MMKNERGFALVLALIVTALLVAIVAEFTHDVYVETSLHRNQRDMQQASLLARGGVVGAVRLVQSVRYDAAKLQLALATPLEVPLEEGTVRVIVEQEEGKLNLNAVTYPNGTANQYFDPAESRLLKLLGYPEGLHDTLADWIDTDNDPRSGGAETSYYRSLATPYEAKNGPLDTFGELGLIKGFTPALVEGLRSYATVYPKAGRSINVNTAPAKVLQALDSDITPEIAAAIIARRREKPFASVGEVSQVTGMETIVPRLAGVLDVTGNTFRFISQAQVGGVTRVVEAVVVMGSQKNLYWREY